jgi:hypothetical protein
LAGAHCAQALSDGAPVAGRWFDRTLEGAAARRRLTTDPAAFVTLEQLRLAPLPCWRHMSSARRRVRVRELIAGIEAEAAATVEHTGRSALGRERIFRQDPSLAPKRLRKGPAPLAHAASRAARDALRDAYRHFVAAYRHAAERLQAGARDVLFPVGSFPPALPFQLQPEAG